LLHVAQISFFLDPLGRTATQILRDWWPLVDCAEMVERCGARVSVIQACSQAERVSRNGVDYHFVAPDRGESSIARASKFVALVRALNPDVFHVHGLCFPRDVLVLARLAPHVPILLQDHASGVPRWWQRRLWRREFSVVAGVSFCALEQAQPFLETGLLHPQAAIVEIAECSSRFTPGDRQAARRATGLHGDPAVLYVGNLDPNKDPLTVLAGISRAVPRLPALQLWCCFRQSPLLADVRSRIDADPQLSTRVHLLGNVPHQRIEQLMRAADLFVLGSHREGSGCSVIEALACGLPPVITDIPSFRALTAAGHIGALWPCGDPHELCEALRSTAARPQAKMRVAVRAHFDAELSFEAVGRKLVVAYEDLLQGKRMDEEVVRQSSSGHPVRQDGLRWLNRQR
jgi:glycosyltransferase involved in cell wall biosynthesis